MGGVKEEREDLKGKKIRMGVRRERSEAWEGKRREVPKKVEHRKEIRGGKGSDERGTERN